MEEHVLGYRETGEEASDFRIPSVMKAMWNATLTVRKVTWISCARALRMFS